MPNTPQDGGKFGKSIIDCLKKPFTVIIFK